ncbi:MAG: hypothetical protein AAGJ46_15990 [Planctomycetota bacterium]
MSPRLSQPVACVLAAFYAVVASAGHALHSHQHGVGGGCCQATAVSDTDAASTCCHGCHVEHAAAAIEAPVGEDCSVGQGECVGCLLLAVVSQASQASKPAESAARQESSPLPLRALIVASASLDGFDARGPPARGLA